MLYEKEQLELEDLKRRNEAPEWYTVKSYITLSKGYRLRGETPRGMYDRISKLAAESLGEPELKDKFFEYIWNNWLCPPSPVLSNLGVQGKGLPISCFGVSVDDSVNSIMEKASELALLTKNGGGVGVNFSNIRPNGSNIFNGINGKSDGIIPFAKIYDSTVSGISQGSTRRGAASINLDIEHGDWDQFLRMRRPEGDIYRQCGNLHHCAVISDEFMEKVISGDIDARIRWADLLRSRMETGEPFIMFKDSVNKANPDAYKNNGLEVEYTNICSEITLFSDPDHSFVCCLSSLNLARWDEWKDTDLPEIATSFVNGIMSYFIDKGRNIDGFESAVRSAEKGRAIGIGVLGWHTLLQSKGMKFDSFDSMMLNNEIFSTISEKAKNQSKVLAKKYGEPEWCKGTGFYNTHLLAVAPTRSNSVISGGISAGIEPIERNLYVDRTAKGNFYERNPILEALLESKGKNTKPVWNQIRDDKGSVRNLKCLNDEEKEVFKTAFEIHQPALIRQAAQRQKYICQAQSLNLFFDSSTNPKYFNDCHILAWKLGVKTVYYCKSTSTLGVAATLGSEREDTIEGCSSCEG